MSANRTVPPALIIGLILVISSFIIGITYMNSQDRPEETENPVIPPSDLKQDEPEHEPDEAPLAVDEPEEENIEPIQETEAPCEVRVEGILLSGETFYAGEPVEVRVLLRNHGDANCLHELELRVSGEHEAERVIDLEAGEEMEIAFTITRDAQGGFIFQAGNLSAMFYVIHASLEISGLTIAPDTIDPGDPVLFSVDVYNPNNVETTGNVRFHIGEGDPLDRTATVGPQSTQIFTVNITMFDPGWHYVRVGNNSGFLVVIEEPSQEEEPDPDPTRPEPTFYWEPDPLTDNFTNILPPGSSPVRLSLPASIEDIFFEWESGPGAYGLHAGGTSRGSTTSGSRSGRGSRLGAGATALSPRSGTRGTWSTGSTMSSSTLVRTSPGATWRSRPPSSRWGTT